MDLLATVRKEGSRGGQGDFKWSDVQSSSRREHYLGHSLMAPVGRWAKGRDLHWYSKGEDQDNDGEDPAETAARERKEEIKRIKEAEEDALARALGLPVAPRNNANLEPVSRKREVNKVLEETTGIKDEGVKDIGDGSLTAQQEQNVWGEKLADGDIAAMTSEGIEVAVGLVNDDIVGLTESTIIADIRICHATDTRICHATDTIDEGLDHGVLVELEIGLTELVQGHPLVHAKKTSDDTDYGTISFPANTTQRYPS